MSRRRAQLSAALLGVLLLAGCVSLPEDGPVVGVGDETPRQQPEAGVDFDPPLPREGAEPPEIVASFIEAMLAAPARLSRAKAYLTEEAARDWSPASTIVYSDYAISSGGGSMEVALDDAIRIDQRGSWRGPLTDRQSRITLSVVLEDGQWRIDELPQALLVNRTFFDSRFVRATVHWFDPAGRVLVPEPVYVPGGDSMSTALVRSLLLGRPTRLRGVVRSFLPGGLSTSGVVVDSAGQADVRLSTEFPEVVSGELERALAQLSWTLRQVPEVTSLRISGPERPVPLPQGRADLPVDNSDGFDSTGELGAGTLFGLQEGRLVYDGLGDFAPVAGTVGTEDSGWRSFAVEPGGRRVAGVGRSGTTLDLAPVQIEGPPQQILQDAGNLLPPAWDGTGGLWLVDRAAGGAEVYLASGRRVRTLSVPGIGGQRVRAFQVSRDGSRFVALLRGDRSDRVVVSRVVRDRRGRVRRLQPARTAYRGSGVPVRMRDLAWSSSTSVLVLFATTGEVSQVREVSLDGSTDAVGAPLTAVRGRMSRLIGSPRAEDPAFAAGRDGAGGIEGAVVPRLPSGLDPRTLTYPG